MCERFVCESFGNQVVSCSSDETIIFTKFYMKRDVRPTEQDECVYQTHDIINLTLATITRCEYTY